MKTFNRNQLKLFMLFLMTLDHIPMFVSVEVSTFFHLVSRCVAVFFGYMVVEGMIHTKNKYNYTLRLWISALIMLLGNTILNFIFGLFFSSTRETLYLINNNIFLTLAIGATILCLADRIKQQSTLIAKGLIILAVTLMLLAGSLFSEGGLVVLPFILITFLTKNKKRTRIYGYLILSLVTFFLSDFQPLLQARDFRDLLLMLGYNSSWLFLLVLPILKRYDGKKVQTSKKQQHFFYLYYPLHLWLISLVANFIL